MQREAFRLNSFLQLLSGGSTLSLLGALLLVLLVTLPAPSLSAQTLGSIAGRVTDIDGSPLDGATVTVTGEVIIGGQRISESGRTGAYRIPGLAPGLYQVKAELAGYQTHLLETVRVSANSATTVSFRLQSTFSDEVNVIRERPLLELTSSSVWSTFGEEELATLPTKRRNWDYLEMAPGITQHRETTFVYATAFGAGLQSNSWLIDGVASDAGRFGVGWWFNNPELLAEVQVVGIGAPAEFGNNLGTVFNFVTRSGGNELHGAFNYYWQSDALTDANVDLEGSDFPEPYRNIYRDATAVLSGPLVKDKVWFLAAFEYFRDGFTPAGANPDLTPTYAYDRPDLKLTGRFADRHNLELRYHNSFWEEPQAAIPNREPAALVIESGSNPAWALSYGGLFGEDTFVEAKYGGWWGDDVYESQTGSQEPLQIDYTQSPPAYHNGIYIDRTYETARHQADVTVSHFADQLLGDHDFKFGVQYGLASDETISKISYYSHWDFGDLWYYGAPVVYGSESETIATFVDDSWHLNEQVTVNLGLRWDHVTARIPSFNRLDADMQPSGERSPAIDPVLSWDNISPRLGIAYSPDAMSVLRGSFGVYYDGPVSGNWDYPGAGAEPFRIFMRNPATSEYELLIYESVVPETAIDPELAAPRTLQYALGYERQLGRNTSFGVQLIYKETADLIGWEILNDGIYEDFLYTDPFTGTEHTLWSIITAPTVRKGNRPGQTPVAGDSYYQDYHAVILTFTKSYSDSWRLSSSYTYSESKGRLPQPQWPVQGLPMLTSRVGSDPNHAINADQLLQGDRKHVLKVQASFDLPWDMVLSTVVNLQSGRPYNRQITVHGMNQGPVTVIMDPADDSRRHSFQKQIDLSIGKRLRLGRTTLHLDALILNLLNEDAEDRWSTLVLQSPGDEYTVAAYLRPRRIMLRLGLDL
jgi:hypothetical protein